MMRWTTVYEVTVETEFRPSVSAERAMCDAMADGAVGASLAHECGEVRVRARGDEPYEADAIDNARKAET